ncbi:DUF6951 family protein [Holophaga foetida]|uniref:DUF6951 family protein n=1 Tax=Holophaga foetida TaxID=35839 RepID=UPI0002471828|nr:hypothetical protein [Holophaga foetida]
MSMVAIDPDVRGFHATVEVTSEGRMCLVSIQCDGKAIQQIAEELGPLDPMQKIASRRGPPRSLELSLKHCFHAACPLPVGIIKAIEVEKKLALPRETSIKFL